MQRLFNMHPTQAFVGQHQSKHIIHQPAKGVWEMQRKKVPNPKSPRKFSWETKLVCVDPNKQAPNYIDVPDDYAHIMLKGNPSGLAPNGEIDAYHHGGHLKPQKEVDVIITSVHQQRLDDLAKLEAQIAEKQKLLDQITVATHTEAAKPKGEKGSRQV